MFFLFSSYFCLFVCRFMCLLVCPLFVLLVYVSVCLFASLTVLHYIGNGARTDMSVTNGD